ncbi:cell division protein FtsX [Balneola sp. MJW-20]|uniref:cell division protein FtsX n=1 Tax=Gracilimonas aurantiaca TaxID=3234185 RepID=UPI003466A9B0
MNLKYVVKEGFTGLKRAKIAATTSVFSLFIAILLLGILGRVSYNLYTQAMEIRNMVEVEVFLFDIDDGTRRQIETNLKNQELVESVTYISKDSASSVMKKEFGEGVDDLVELNFLPASYRVRVNLEAGSESISDLVSRIKNFRGVDEVQYNAALLRVMESNLSMLALVGGGLGLLILLTAVVLVYNTIRLTIYAKRDLIRAMKLVGATNKFIRSPFIVEGILQGLVAGTLAVVCVFLVFELLVPVYLPDLGVVSWPFGRWYFQVGIMFLLAIIMGWWGSRWAARRFIQETYISS